MKSAIELLEQYIIKSGLLSEFLSSVDYIKDFGDVSLYYSTEDATKKMQEVETYLSKAIESLDSVCQIVKDNYEV